MCECSIGKAAAKIVIDFPSNITAGEEYSGSCTFSGEDESFDVILPEKKCKKYEVEYVSHHRINFNLTCEDGPYNATIECDTSIHHNRVEFKGKTNIKHSLSLLYCKLYSYS